MKAKRGILMGTAAVCACALSFGLAGCASGAHQVISASKQCSECHSEEKATYEVAEPAGAIEVTNEVTVTTEGDAVSVCLPTYTAENGSTYVPVEQRAVAVSDGSATIDLEEGVWVLALDNGDSATCQLVKVTGEGSTSLEL